MHIVHIFILFNTYFNIYIYIMYILGVRDKFEFHEMKKMKMREF